jgi:hypothetical protein
MAHLDGLGGTPVCAVEHRLRITGVDPALRLMRPPCCLSAFFPFPFLNQWMDSYIWYECYAIGGRP